MVNDHPIMIVMMSAAKLTRNQSARSRVLA